MNVQKKVFIGIYGIYLAISTMIIQIYFLSQLAMIALGYPIVIPNAVTYGRRLDELKIEIGNDNTLYLAFYDGGGIKTYYSKDQGSTWNEISPSVSNPIRIDLAINDQGELSIIFEDDKYFLYHIKYTKDEFWTYPKLIEKNYGDFTHAFIANSKLLLSFTSPDRRTKFLLSSDHGNSWEEHSYYDYSFPNKIVHSENDTLYFSTYEASSSKNILLKSIDLGKTWIVQNNALPGNGENLLIHPTNGYLYDAFVSLQYIKIVFSEDEGKTWNYWKPAELDKKLISKDWLELSIAFSSEGSCFILHQTEITSLGPVWFSTFGLHYFWIEKDIWILKYTYNYLITFLPVSIVGLLFFWYTINRHYKKKKRKKLNVCFKSKFKLY